MTLADSHVKALLKEGTSRAGSPPSGAEWRVAPEAVEAAKARIEEYARRLGEQAARTAGGARRSTLKADDLQEPGSQGPGPQGSGPAPSADGDGGPPAFS